MSFPGHPPFSITSPRGWKSEPAAVALVAEVAGAAAGAKPDRWESGRCGSLLAVTPDVHEKCCCVRIST
jgi:hypothetical protein